MPKIWLCWKWFNGLQNMILHTDQQTFLNSSLRVNDGSKRQCPVSVELSGVNKIHPPVVTLPWLWTERGEEVSSNIHAFQSSWWPRVSCSVLARAERPSYSVPLCVFSHRGTSALSCSKQPSWRNHTAQDRQRIIEVFQVRVTLDGVLRPQWLLRGS